MSVKNKKNIPQWVIVISIVIVSLVLAVAIVIGSDKVLDNRLNKFEANLKSVEDFCINESSKENLDNYFIFEGIKTSDLKAKVEEEKVKDLEEELRLNNETVDSIFYKIDIEKIDKDKKDSNYYMSMQTSKVYNLKGIEAYGETFFSLTSKIKEARIKNNRITKETKNNLKNTYGFFVERIEDGKVVISFQEYINTNEKLEMQVEDYLGKVYTENITNLVKNNEYTVMPKGSITKEAITNPNRVSFILTKKGKVLKQDLTKENTVVIDYITPIISLVDIQTVEDGKIIYIDSEKEITCYYLETKVSDAFGNKVEQEKVVQDEEKFAKEIVSKGNKVEDRNLKIDKNVCSVSIVGVDNLGNVSNVLNIENIDALF